MKKIISALLITLMLTATSCSAEIKNTDSPEPTVATTTGTAASETEAEIQTLPSIKILTDLDDYEYPDKLNIKEGGIVSLTLFKCGNGFYACNDGFNSWDKVSGPADVDLKDGEFLHADTKYNLMYGGIKGFVGQRQITEISNEKKLSVDEVVTQGSIAPYDASKGAFQSPRLIVKDGRNYIICRDPLLKYRLYDDKGELLCTEDTYMACADYIEDDKEHNISYSASGNFPFWVVRVGDIYYAYSRYGENNSWKALLNMKFENKPVGFELEDGQVMKVDSTSFYIVNGGENNYVNVPMFEKMDHFSWEQYTSLNSDCSKDHWDRVSSYEEGKSYQYYANNTEYVIFRLEGRFHVYGDMETEKLLGGYDTSAEVNKALGI